jgi:hypothetical protein
VAIPVAPEREREALSAREQAREAGPAIEHAAPRTDPAEPSSGELWWRWGPPAAEAATSRAATSVDEPATTDTSARGDAPATGDALVNSGEPAAAAEPAADDASGRGDAPATGDASARGDEPAADQPPQDDAPRPGESRAHAVSDAPATPTVIRERPRARALRNAARPATQAVSGVLSRAAQVARRRNG